MKDISMEKKVFKIIKSINIANIILATIMFVLGVITFGLFVSPDFINKFEISPVATICFIVYTIVLSGIILVSSAIKHALKISLNDYLGIKKIAKEKIAKPKKSKK